PDEASEAVDDITNSSEEQLSARVFFKRNDDFLTLSTATEAIFPEDDNGPGAIELGVPYFIDKQLEGPWGNNGRNYMMGPFNVGESPATRADIFIQGLRSLNRISNSEHDQNFSDLEEEQVISLLEQ